MFDVKRIRERAADWLGDVGSAALFVAGDVLGAVGSAVRGSPHEEAFERGDETDDELRARIKATLYGTSPPAGQDHAPHPPGGVQAVDRGWILEVGADELTCPCGDILVEGSWPWPPGGRCLYCCTCRSSYEIGTMRELRVGDAPREVNAEGYAGNMQACDACDGPAAEPSDGPTLVHDQNRWRRAADGFVWTVRAVLEDGAYQMVREGDRDAAGPTLIVSPVELTHERLWRLEPRPAVKPPHNAGPGALGEALRFERTEDPATGELLYRRLSMSPPANLCTIAAEATRATDGPALAANIEAQRISHGGCTRLPREMLDALGVKDGDLLWFLRSTPGGRWEAWTAPELDEEFCIGQELGPEHVAARKAAVDAMPHHVASRLTSGEARRLEAVGHVAGVVWYHDNVGNQFCRWHEGDDQDLASLRKQASGAPQDRDTHPLASAAERVPESPSGGASTSSRLTVAATVPGPSGDPWTDVATFDGPEAETMARALADSLSAAVDAIVSTGKSAPPALPKPDAVRVGQRWRAVDFTHDVRVTAVNSGLVHVAAVDGPTGTVPESFMLRLDAWSYLGMAKPSRVEVGQRWRCVGVDGELVVRWLYEDGVSVRLGPAEDEASGKVVARIVDMLGLREWSYLGGAR